MVGKEREYDRDRSIDSAVSTAMITATGLTTMDMMNLMTATGRTLPITVTSASIMMTMKAVLIILSINNEVNRETIINPI